MKIIKTKSYKLALTDYQAHPSIKPTDNDLGPARNILNNEKDTKDEIKKRWRKKRIKIKKIPSII
jgi:hypothetical protein